MLVGALTVRPSTAGVGVNWTSDGVRSLSRLPEQSLAVKTAVHDAVPLATTGEAPVGASVQVDVFGSVQKPPGVNLTSAVWVIAVLPARADTVTVSSRLSVMTTEQEPSVPVVQVLRLSTNVAEPVTAKVITWPETGLPFASLAVTVAVDVPPTPVSDGAAVSVDVPGSTGPATNGIGRGCGIVWPP